MKHGKYLFETGEHNLHRLTFGSRLLLYLPEGKYNRTLKTKFRKHFRLRRRREPRRCMIKE